MDIEIQTICYAIEAFCDKEERKDPNNEFLKQCRIIMRALQSTDCYEEQIYKNVLLILEKCLELSKDKS